MDAQLAQLTQSRAAELVALLVRWGLRREDALALTVAMRAEIKNNTSLVWSDKIDLSDMASATPS